MDKRIIAALLCASALSGCATEGPPYGPLDDALRGLGLRKPSEERATGSKSVIDQAEIAAQLDLVALLDPEGRRYKMCRAVDDDREADRNRRDRRNAVTACQGVRKKSRKGAMVSASDRDCAPVEPARAEFSADEYRFQFARAHAAFYTYSNKPSFDEPNADAAFFSQLCSAGANGAGSTTTPLSFSGEVARRATYDLSLIMRRNAVQDAIIQASNQSCSIFKLSLNDKLTKADFGFGSTATLLAGLGAIFTDPATARGLSGASAIVSGWRTDYRSAYLEGQTLHVITAGIDQVREEILDDINGRRFGPPHSAANRVCEDPLNGAAVVEYQETVKAYAAAVGEVARRKVIGDEKEVKKAQAEEAAAAAKMASLAPRQVCYATHPYTPLSPYDKYEKEQVTSDAAKLRANLDELKTQQAKLDAENVEFAKYEKLEKDVADKTREVELAEAAVEGAQGIAIVRAQAESSAIGSVTAVRTATDDEIVRKSLDIAARSKLMSNPTDGDVIKALEADVRRLKDKKECLDRAQKSAGGEINSADAIAACDAASGAQQIDAAIQRLSARTATAAPTTTNSDSETPQHKLDRLNGELTNAKTLRDDGKQAGAAARTARDAANKKITELKAENEILDRSARLLSAQNEEVVGLVPLSQYSVQMAMADAVTYHDACSIPAGLHAAAKSIEEVRDPGFPVLNKALDNLILVRDKINEYNSKLKGADADD